MTKIISLHVTCPHCSHSLMDEDKLINNRPSIRTEIQTSIKQKGYLWLSSIYGDYNVLSEFPIVEGDVVDFYCPYCHESLKRKKVECDVCSAPIAFMNVDVGGRVSFCTRSGCKNHYVVFEDLDTIIRKFYDEYGYH